MTRRKLTPEGAERIRARAAERTEQRQEMRTTEKQLAVRDPELEQFDAEVYKEVAERCGDDAAAELFNEK